MTKVATIRGMLNGIVETVLPAYVKLPDSYDSPDNANAIWEKAYSIGYASGENVTEEWCNLGSMRIKRQFQVTLVNNYLPNMDADYREGLEDSLFNDQFALVAAIERDPTLTGMDVTSRYSFDNGLEYLIDERKQFIIVAMTITVDYFEETT